MNDIYYKNISVVIEIERAIKFLKIGLVEIQKISAENDFYDYVFIFLSGGLERLFKTMLCLNFKDKEGRFPELNECWEIKMGHDLELLKKMVETICIPLNNHFVISMGYDISIDYDIITKDDFINRICKVLSEYGKRGRYFNMDAILGREQQFNPKDEWEKLETEVYQEKFGKDKYYQLLSSCKIEEFYYTSNIEMVIRLEKFFRALTRQFIFGKFSKDAKSFSSIVEIFSKIEDDKLGKTDYM
jgi:hypothetical protein